MNDVLEILNEVAGTSSRLEKEAILTRNASNPELKRVFKYAYDKQILFYTRQIPDESMWGVSDQLKHTLWGALALLDAEIVSRKKTGNAANAFLEELFMRVTPETAEVLKRVILGDLRIGATSGTANKVWKDLIEKPGFQLAQTDAKNIVYPAFSQLKEDGTRGKLIYDGYGVTVISRNGNAIETLGVFDNWATRKLVAGDRVDGELVTFDENGKRLSRQEGNGIINKAVQGTISKEEAKALRFVAWDVESMEGVKYIDRFRHLEGVVNEGDPVVLVESTIVENYAEAVEHFRAMRKRGYEGTILKNANAFWVGKRTFDMVKFKAEIDAEFKVIGKEEGKGKNKGRLGALLISTSDDLVQSDVGIFKDFPDSIRDDWWTNPPSIVTVRYNERITSKGSDIESLFLPRVIAVRYDKDTANSRDELIEIERGILEG